ncbi:metal ABC transporter solute-binding protein, Zn/Mn family [Candidatus Finniella inopinata]|uniref:Metal ABC transporter substrate-binding protein n=1 Tax=Candidatus Finniella inopinata TaxID=1696036 RepID=A0A4Q7DPF6_9PROT|nr:zinc ABC transporter substrate-binding protein [Candidatus Finniella inopinata]RZI46876.1 metal ABC transporter substrate-binding protein [Candidatus Finniella inopinata]
MRIAVVFFLLLMLGVILMVGSRNVPPNSAPTLKIVTSFSILKDFVQNISKGNENVQIASIVPLESDPHTYQPTPKDSVALANADLIFINGLDFEKGIEKMITSSGFAGKVCDASDGITPRTEPLDPHLWHDVKNAKVYVANIVRFLCEHDPAHKKLYEANKGKLLEQLDLLDRWIREQFARVPFEQRLVVTTHDAFWYFGKAYGIQFLAPVGISTETEASAQKVATLIDLIKEKGVKAVFVENLANPRLLQQIAEETGVMVQGTLYADSLSASAGPAATYEAMMRHNVSTIRQALEKTVQCKP